MRILLRLTLAGSLAPGLAACSSPAAQPTPSSTYKDYSGHAAEYREATKRLDLPPSATWPAVEPSPAEKHRYANGVGTTKAEMHWYCQWEKEWLASYRSDASRATAALAQLQRVKGFQVYTAAFDGAGRRQVDDSLAKAQAGDGSGVQADVQANCQ